jgi:catechol 2,3-dioxygenase-like lactoylglutathione lyase family enzyme
LADEARGRRRAVITGGIPTIYVSDMDRAVKFYTEALGLKLRYQAGPGWAEVEVGGSTIGLHGTHPGGPPAGQSGSISVGMTVDEPLDRVVETLKARGVQFRGPIREDTAIRLAFFGDPDGNDLYLCEVQAMDAEAGHAEDRG